MARLDGQIAKKVVTAALLALLFVVSFIGFLYLTFPYEVLKESIGAEVAQSTGYSVRIGEMGPGFPLGISASNIRVASPNGAANLSLSTLHLDVSVLGLLIGKPGFVLKVTKDAGSLVVGVDFGLMDLIGGLVMPKQFNMEAKNFPLDDFVAFGLATASSSPTANPMVAPLISALGFTGMLSANADFKLDPRNLSQSAGAAEFTLSKAILKLSHPSLGLPDQQFKKAQVKMKVENGSLVIDKNSGFNSDELELGVDGKVTLKPVLTASILDVKVIVKLEKGLKDKFGFLMDAVTGSAASEGQLTMQVRGSMDQPAVTTF